MKIIDFAELDEKDWKGGSKHQELSAADGSVQTIHPFLQPLLHTLHWWYPNVQSQKLEWLD